MTHTRSVILAGAVFLSLRVHRTYRLLQASLPWWIGLTRRLLALPIQSRSRAAVTRTLRSFRPSRAIPRISSDYTLSMSVSCGTWGARPPLTSKL